MSCAWASTPGVDGSSGVATMSGKERSAGADEHDLAREVGEVGVGLKHLPGRDGPARVGFGEPHAQLAISLDGNDDVAVLDRVDAVGLAGRAAEGGRRFHDIAGRPLGDPNRLEREARLDLAVDLSSSGTRRTTRSLSGSQFKSRDRSKRRRARESAASTPLKGSRKRRRIADEGEAGLRREARLGAIVGRGEKEAERRRTTLMA